MIVSKNNIILLGLWLVVAEVLPLLRVDPLVETKVGLIRGLMSDDGTYSMFLGIPYAVVNESNPFGVSIPHKGFEGVFDANDDSAICPQITEFNNTITGSLDCLHINIYVPNTASSTNRLPVLVWIYGGGFRTGFSGLYLYGPKFFLRHHIILVTLNYRLGPYGFMCLDNPKVPGNQGLKDQQLGLKWIRDNMGAFGGDPNQITGFGESAGSMSVDLQLMYSKEKLFDKIIMQSGTSQSHLSVMEADREAPLKIAENLGFITDDIDTALNYLSKIDTDLIIAASTQISFIPCVEQQFENIENFIDIHPLNANLPKDRSVPVLIGYNDDEYISFLTDFFGANRPKSHDGIFTQILSDAFDFDTHFNEMKDLMRRFYVGDEELNDKTMWNVIDFGSDIAFIHPTVRSIEKFKQNDATVYHYVFSYVGGRNIVKDRLNISLGGAAHADEIGYQFDISYMGEPSYEDQIIIDRMSTLWSNFVKFGNPTPKPSILIPLIWQPVSEDTLHYLNIDSDLSMRKRPFYQRMSFWDLFMDTNLKYRKGYKYDDALYQ